MPRQLQFVSVPHHSGFLVCNGASCSETFAATVPKKGTRPARELADDDEDNDGNDDDDDDVTRQQQCTSLVFFSHLKWSCRHNEVFNGLMPVLGAEAEAEAGRTAKPTYRWVWPDGLQSNLSNIAATVESSQSSVHFSFLPLRLPEIMFAPSKNLRNCQSLTYAAFCFLPKLCQPLFLFSSFLPLSLSALVIIVVLMLCNFDKVLQLSLKFYTQTSHSSAFPSAFSWANRHYYALHWQSFYIYIHIYIKLLKCVYFNDIFVSPLQMISTTK